MTIDSALAEVVEAAVAKAIAPLAAEVRALRTERQHAAGHWVVGRAEAGRQLGDVGIDAVESMIARGELRAERIGPEPKKEEQRHDARGRRIDHRPWRIWIPGPPRSPAEIEQLAQEARAT